MKTLAKSFLTLLLLGMASVVSALEKDEYVYTPQGRFLITGDNLNANSAFADFTGWTLATAQDGKTIDLQWNINTDGYAEGINSVASLDATAGEGMYYTFVPSSPYNNYVVSYKMKASAVTSVRVKTVAVSTNLALVQGNSDNTFGGQTDVLTANTAEELTTEWQTFNYAIVGDGTPRTYYISFTGMATDIEIADVQIAEAMPFADLRLRDALVEKMETYRNCYPWEQDVLDEYGFDENLDALKAIGDESSVEELAELLAICQDVLALFQSEKMDDFLSNGSALNYLRNDVGKQVSRVSSYGIWTCIPGGRGYWTAGSYPYMGHFPNGNTWNYDNPNSPMGMTTQMELEPGSYVFYIESAAALREPKRSNWNNDDGLKPAYGDAYIVKIVDGAAADTIASVKKDLGCTETTMTPFILSVKITETATYEFGVKAYCKEAYQALKLGSVTYVGNASILAKTENKYSRAELIYENNVRAQITAGRNAITTANGYLADEAYWWDKAELQDSVALAEPRIAAYEAMTQDDIIATYDEEEYVASVNNPSGLLEYEVYQTATKFIVAANMKFVAINDTLATMQKVIDNAEAILRERVYSAATGRTALQTAISEAKRIQSQMKTSDYSEENVAAIVAANAALTEAIETFKTTIPAEAIATLVDIDFEHAAVMDEETQLYNITGTTGTMEFTNFSAETYAINAIAYQQGLWDNDVHQYKGYLRVGNGTGTVTFDPTVDGATVGTNILKINCDLFLQGLIGRYYGFFIKSEADSTLASFYADYYNNKIHASSTLPVDLGSLKYGSGFKYANMPPQGATDLEGNPVSGTTLAKNSFEVIMDFGEGSVYCTTTSDKGVVTTDKVAFDKTTPVKFVLQSNYNNNDRRPWFDNLKIQRIKAGEAEPFVPDSIEKIAAAKKADNAVYSITGVKMNGSLKPGLYIINGKKYIVK